jgi:hypothetical protein
MSKAFLDEADWADEADLIDAYWRTVAKIRLFRHLSGWSWIAAVHNSTIFNAEVAEVTQWTQRFSGSRG